MVELHQQLLRGVGLNEPHQIRSDFLIVRENDDLIEVEVRQGLEHARAILRVCVAQRRVDHQRQATSRDVGQGEREGHPERAAFEPTGGPQREIRAAIGKAHHRITLTRQADAAAVESRVGDL